MLLPVLTLRRGGLRTPLPAKEDIFPFCAASQVCAARVSWDENNAKRSFWAPFTANIVEVQFTKALAYVRWERCFVLVIDNFLISPEFWGLQRSHTSVYPMFALPKRFNNFFGQ